MSTVAPCRPPLGALPPPAAPATTGQALLDAAEKDLTALADRMHDDVLQALLVARYAADAAVRGGDPSQARDAVQDALVRLRRTVWHVRPRGHAGLRDALDELSAQRVQAGDAPLSVDLDDGAGQLEPTAARLAYRLVQASRTSAVRLARDGAAAVLTLTPTVELDAAVWQLRAETLGGALTATSAGVRLMLPTVATDDLVNPPTTKDVP